MFFLGFKAVKNDGNEVLVGLPGVPSLATHLSEGMVDALVANPFSALRDVWGEALSDSTRAWSGEKDGEGCSAIARSEPRGLPG